MTVKELTQIQTMVKDAVNEAVPDAVRVTVNGKVDNINTKLDAHIQQHKEDMETLEPVTKFFTNLSGFKAIVVVIFLPVAVSLIAIFGAVPGFEMFIHYINPKP